MDWTTVSWLPRMRTLAIEGDSEKFELIIQFTEGPNLKYSHPYPTYQRKYAIFMYFISNCTQCHINYSYLFLIVLRVHGLSSYSPLMFNLLACKNMLRRLQIVSVKLRKWLFDWSVFFKKLNVFMMHILKENNQE